MSITSIAGNIFSQLNQLQSSQSGPSAPSSFKTISSEFQQLGQDLQSGNLTQAQTDFATLSQSLASENSASGGAIGAPGGTNPGNTNPLTQAFTQLGQDLQSGNLQAAQQEYTAIQQNGQQFGVQGIPPGGFRHHGIPERTLQFSSAQPAATTSETNSINQVFSQLAQSVQGNNLQGAQTAFASLQADLQQIGGFAISGASGPAATAESAGLNLLV